MYLKDGFGITNRNIDITLYAKWEANTYQVKFDFVLENLILKNEYLYCITTP